MSLVDYTLGFPRGKDRAGSHRAPPAGLDRDDSARFARGAAIAHIRAMQTDAPRRAVLGSHGIICFVLFALAFAVRSVGLGFGLPHALARPDEETIVGNALSLEESPDLNPRFFSYPSLMIYTSYGLSKAMHLMMRFSGDTDAATLRQLFLENPACFHWTIRLFSLVCGALTPVAVFAAARRLYGTRTAIASGLVLALCYLHVRDSHFGVTDVPFVFLVSLSFWQLVKVFQRGRIRHLCFASIFAGLAIGMKYTGAWLCLPFSVAIVQAVRHLTVRRRQYRFAAMCGVGIVLTVAAFAVTSPYFFLDFSRARDDLLWEMILVNKEAPIAEGINGYVDHFRVSLWYGLGWPVLLVALASGVVMGLRKSGRGLLIWCLPVGFYLYTGLSNRVFIRYMDIVLPFLAVACGWGIRAAIVCGCSWWRKRPSAARWVAARRATWRRWVPVAVALVLLIPSMRRIYFLDQRLERTDTRLELRQWLLQNVPPSEPILWSGGWSAMPYMIHHVPIRYLHATEKVLPRDPDAVPRYRWIVLVEWPVAYYLMGNRQADQERALVRREMASRYQLVHEIDAYKADLPPELFSRLDHFYMSFAEPEVITRPGPGYRIYRRIDSAGGPIGRVGGSLGGA